MSQVCGGSRGYKNVVGDQVFPASAIMRVLLPHGGSITEPLGNKISAPHEPVGNLALHQQGVAEVSKIQLRLMAPKERAGSQIVMLGKNITEFTKKVSPLLLGIGLPGKRHRSSGKTEERVRRPGFQT